VTIHAQTGDIFSVGDDGVQLAVIPPDITGPARDAWCEWLTRHGIDPARVALVRPAGVISRIPSRRRVTYLDLERDDDGRIVLRDGDVHKVVRTVQLESEPLPFPSVTDQ
jgi:hypothetical protein